VGTFPVNGASTKEMKRPPSSVIVPNRLIEARQPETVGFGREFTGNSYAFAQS
jgi:hypothetical protein